MDAEHETTREEEERSGEGENRPFPVRRWAAQLGMALLLLLLLEGALRLFGWPSGRVRAIGHLVESDAERFEKGVGPFRPNVRATVAWPRELAYTVRTNQYGLRGPDLAEPKPEGEWRLLCLGDSTTFGFYVSEEETYPARLSEILKRDHRDVEVINAGCGGWTIAEETLFLTERSAPLEPDAVLLLFSPNDLLDLRDEPWWDAHARLLKTRGGEWRRALGETALGELALRIRLALKTEDDVEKGGGPAQPDSDESEALWTAYEAWFEKLVQEADRRNLPLLVAAYPDAAYVLNGASTEAIDRLRRLAERHEIPFCNPLGDFRRADDPEALYHLPRDPHPTARGNQLLARILAGKLKELGWYRKK